MLRSHNCLISIDGSDGLGKSSLAAALAQAISLEDSGSLLVRPTAFDTSPAAQEIGRQMKMHSDSLELDCQKHNEYYLLALRANYSFLRSIIADNVRVVLDSSEIRALAFIIDNGTAEAVEQTRQMLADGELTDGLSAKYRVLLSATPEVVMNNLATRPVLDRGDPSDHASRMSRIRAYEEAADFVAKLRTVPDPEWIHIPIEHVEAGKLLEYHSHLVHDIIMPRIE